MDDWPETIFSKMPDTWASTEDYEAFMKDLASGKAMSVMKEDGKQYHVPIEEWSAAAQEQEGE